MHIGHPQIQCASTQHQLSANRVGKRDNPTVAIHRRKPRAANAVELDTFRSCGTRFFLVFGRTSHAHDLAHHKRRMSVHRDVYPTLLQRTKIHDGFTAFRQTEQAIHCNGRTQAARPSKGNARAQELLHNVTPIAIGTDTGFVQAFEYLVVHADGQDTQLFPGVQTLLRCEGMDGFMVIWHRTRKILQQNICHFYRKLIEGFAGAINPELLTYGTNLRLALDGKVQRAFARTFQRQHALTTTGTVRCGPRGKGTQHVTSDYQIGVGAAYATWCLLGYLARAHEAILAADARDAERTLRLLGIKAVEYRIDAELLHAQEHIAHGRIGRLFDNLLLVCKRLLVFTHSLHVVIKICTIMAMVMAMFMLVLALRYGAGKFLLVYPVLISTCRHRRRVSVAHLLSFSFLVFLLGF